MYVCPRCGDTVKFRDIDGETIPIHVSGPCRGGSEVKTFPGYYKFDEAVCKSRICPRCLQTVYFIKHNGGSVWIDPPLGPPWNKHPCFDAGPQRGVGHVSKSSIVHGAILARARSPQDISVGVTTSARPTLHGHGGSTVAATLIEFNIGDPTPVRLTVEQRGVGYTRGRILAWDKGRGAITIVDEPDKEWKVLEPAGLLTTPEEPKIITISNLRERPEFQGTVINRAWQTRWQSHGLPLSEASKSLQVDAPENAIPFALVAHEQGIYAGSALVIKHLCNKLYYYTPFITGIFIEPQYKSYKIRDALIEHAINTVRSQKLDEVYIGVKQSRKAFYTDNGWIDLETHDSIFNEYILVKTL